MFASTKNTELNVMFSQNLGDIFNHLIDISITFNLFVFNQFGNVIIIITMNLLETQIFQFILDFT